jgi:hypothetical protein
MSTTVAAIADEAFDDVALELTDVIKTATVTRATANPTYTAATGVYAPASAAITGRAVSLTERAIADIFPGYTAGPTTRGFLLEGLSAAPVEGDKLTVGSVDSRIEQVADIAGAGTLFAVVAV